MILSSSYLQQVGSCIYEGWIEFQDTGSKAIKDRIDVDAVIATLVAGAKA